MYSYYLIVAITGHTPSWKRYVTRLQMTQFTVMISQGGYMLWTCPDPGRRVTQLCAYPFAPCAIHCPTVRVGSDRLTEPPTT
jgi:hypothetical protein